MESNTGRFGEAAIAAILLAVLIIMLTACSGVPVRNYASHEAEQIANEAFNNYLY